MINWQRISELRTEVGEDDLADVIYLFCEEVENVLNVLGGSSRDELIEQLHFLKGSAMNIGLDHMSSLCLAAELQLRDDPSTKPDLAAIKDAYADSKASLASGARTG